jgi:hypothetical protein
VFRLHLSTPFLFGIRAGCVVVAIVELMKI